MLKLNRISVIFIFLFFFLNGCSTPDDPIVEIVDPKPDVEVPAFDSSTLLGTYIFSFANESEVHIYQFNTDTSVLIKHPDNTLDTETWSVNNTGELVITGSVNNIFTLTSGDQLSGELDIILRNAGEIDTKITTTGTIAKQTSAFEKETLLGVYSLTLADESYLYQFYTDNSVVIKHADNSLETESWSVNELGQLVVTGSITNIFTLTSGDQIAGKLNILLQDTAGTTPDVNISGTIAKQSFVFDSETLTGAYILTFETEEEIRVYQFNADTSVLINSANNITSTESWSVNELGQLVITGAVHDFFTLTSGDQTAGEVNILLQDAAGTESAVYTTGTIAVQTSTFDDTMLAGVYQVTFSGEALVDSYQFNTDNSLVIKHADNSLNIENWSVNNFGQLVITGSVTNLFTLTSGNQNSGELHILLQDYDGTNTTGSIAKQTYAFDSSSIPETYKVTFASNEVREYQLSADKTAIIKYADRSTVSETWSINEFGQLIITGSIQTIFTLTSGNQGAGEINVVLRDVDRIEPEINTTGIIEIKILAFDSATLPENYYITFAHKKEIEIYQFNADNSVVISYGNAEGTQSWSVNEAGQLLITGSVNYIFTLTSGDQYLGELSAVLQDIDGIKPEITTTATIKEQTNCGNQFANGYIVGYNSEYSTGDADGSIDGYNKSYNEGYPDGYRKGYDEGYADGYKDGNDYGFGVKKPTKKSKIVSRSVAAKVKRDVTTAKKATIVDDCTAEFNLGYDSGSAAGYDVGYADGYVEESVFGYSDGATDGEYDGYIDGYDKGFDDGYDAANGF